LYRVADGHKERIELYANRYVNGQDIFTGEPLTANDLSDEEATRMRKTAWEARKIKKGTNK
jgi:hypothetical protein